VFNQFNCFAAELLEPRVLMTGAHLVADLMPGAGTSEPYRLYVMGDRVFYQATLGGG
jgi:hypothetical protein